MHIGIVLVENFKAVNLETRSLLNILESKNYHKINFDIHTSMNKLLASLNLNQGFMTSPNIQMLLNMHNYLEKIAERKYRVFEKLHTAHDENFENIGKISENNSNDILQDIVEEEIEIFKSTITNTSHNTPDIKNNRTESNKTEEMSKKINYNWTEIDDKTIKSTNENNGSFVEQLSSNKTDIFDIQAWSSLSEEEFETIETRRIYRGKNTKIKNYPFVVSIHLMSEYLCAGSIISWDMVITAASCLQIAYKNKVFRNNPRTIFVRMGSDYLKHSGDLVPIVEVIFHPQYDSVTLKNNLAILKMLDKIKSNTNKVMRIKYDKTAEHLVDDIDDITIVGWGARSAKDNPKNLQKLAVARLNIYDMNDCKEVYSKYYVTDTNFCAGFTTKGGGACTGDVGGPAVVSAERELVGVVSFGPTVCGMPDAPTVFTKIGYYAEWINAVVNNQKSGHQRDDTIPINRHSTPKTLKIPLYTTTKKTTFKPTPRHITEHAKTKDINNTQDYPDEIILLKKIIQDFILGNASVLDYLTNSQIMKLEIDSTKEEVYFDDMKSKDTEWDRNDKAAKKLSKHDKIAFRDNKKSSIVYTVTTPPIAQNSRSIDFKSTRYNVDYYNVKKTSLRNEDDRVPQDGYYSNYGIEPYRPDESSSYYEVDIPIDDTPFKPQPKSINGYPMVTIPSVDRVPRITKTHKAAVVKAPVPGFNNAIQLKSVSKDEIIYKSVNKESSTARTENFSRGKVKTVDQKAVKYFEYSTFNDKLNKPLYPLGLTMDLSQDDFNYE